MQAQSGHENEGAHGEAAAQVALLVEGSKEAGRLWYDTLARALISIFGLARQIRGYSAPEREDACSSSLFTSMIVASVSSKELIAQHRQNFNVQRRAHGSRLIYRLLGIKITRN